MRMQIQRSNWTEMDMRDAETEVVKILVRFHLYSG